MEISPRAQAGSQTEQAVAEQCLIMTKLEVTWELEVMETTVEKQFDLLPLSTVERNNKQAQFWCNTTPRLI